VKTLEGMAREIFIRYAEKSGVKADWNYLSDNRKLVWMKDILLLSEYFLTNLKNEIKPIPSNKKSTTVYESGFNDGVRSERTSFLVLVDELHEKLLDEYEQLQYSLNKSQNKSE
jgi:hypothetical protein